MDDKLIFRLVCSKSYRKVFQFQNENFSDDGYYYDYCSLFVEVNSGDLVYVPDRLFSDFVKMYEILY